MQFISSSCYYSRLGSQTKHSPKPVSLRPNQRSGGSHLPHETIPCFTPLLTSGNSLRRIGSPFPLKVLPALVFFRERTGYCRESIRELLEQDSPQLAVKRLLN